MTETHRHIILYAKHWYRRSNYEYANPGTEEYASQVIVDLCEILGIIYEYDYKERDILYHITECFSKFLPEHQQQKVIEDTFSTKDLFSTFSYKTEFKWFVSAVLSQLAIIQVNNNPLMKDLGKPDYQMFPMFSKTV